MGHPLSNMSMGLKGFTRGRLKVSVVSTAKYFVPAFIGSFCEKYPDIDIRFEVLNRDGVVQRLENNLDDLYIMSRPPAHIEIEDKVFMSNPLVLIAAKNHPLTKKKNIKLEDIKSERFIFFVNKVQEPRLVMDAHFKKYKFKPNLTNGVRYE
jgi:DNA-binding transcriptional LysR family regulator